MRNAWLIVIAACLLSIPGASQTVSYSGKDLPLKEIFCVIKSQTGIVFFYESNLLDDVRPLTVRWKKVPVEDALNEICKSSSLMWVLEGRTVTVIKYQLQQPSSESAIIHVKGNITDEDGIPLPGVTIMVKGTSRGVASGNAGQFSIDALKENVLLFSSVYYNSKEVKVTRAEMNIQLQLSPKPMETLLVGGNLSAIRRKADATSTTILNAKTLEKIPVNTLDQIFTGWVPGTVSYDVGDQPEGYPGLSIRGAGSAYSLSTIAVYVDGIEYAGGSGYLSQLDKNNIDRIEIVRGPGAATMYGTGSNGGIIQIFTKKGRPGFNTINLTTSAGFYKSKWVEKNPIQQLYNVESITPFKNGTLKLGGSYRTINAYLPDGGEKNTGLYASASFKFGKLEANIVERYNVRDFHLSRNPYYDTATHHRTDIIIEPVPGFKTPAYLWFGVMPLRPQNKDGVTDTYIGGMNLSYKTTKIWVNNLDIGYTKNTVSQVPVLDGSTPLQSQYTASKSKVSTMRYSNVLSLYGRQNSVSATITSGVEYKTYSSSRTITRSTASTTAVVQDPDNKNFGAFIQANPSYKNVYLTLGLRYEKNNFFNAAWNPRIGLTTNFDTRWLTIKPRISWGRGITSPSYQNRFGRPAASPLIIYENPDIKPQRQQGFDYGLELYDKKGNFRFEAIYYDNILQDLIALRGLGPDYRDSSRLTSIYTNVAEVSNKGWEFSANYKFRRFSLDGSFSIMNSTVKDSTGTYLIQQLNLAPGKRLLNLPRHTALLNLSYNCLKLFRKNDKAELSINLTEIDGVKSYDYQNYAIDVAYGRTLYIPGQFAYEVQNSAVFHLGLYFDYYITNDLRFFAQGSNILNDYSYVFPTYLTKGAAWLFGFKYNFSRSR